MYENGITLYVFKLENITGNCGGWRKPWL